MKSAGGLRAGKENLLWQKVKFNAKIFLKVVVIKNSRQLFNLSSTTARHSHHFEKIFFPHLARVQLKINKIETLEGVQYNLWNICI